MGLMYRGLPRVRALLPTRPPSCGGRIVGVAAHVVVNLVAVPLVSLLVVPVGFVWLVVATLVPAVGAATAAVPSRTPTSTWASTASSSIVEASASRPLVRAVEALLPPPVQAATAAHCCRTTIWRCRPTQRRSGRCREAWW